MTDRATAIVPFLSVRRGIKAIEFYKAAFGAQEAFRIENDKGEVVAQLNVGGGTVRMLLVVGDPDAAFHRAVAAGATVVSAVANQHGWRVGRVVDPFGHHWEIGKPLP